MIEIKDLTQIFLKGSVNENIALKNISLNINQGDFITVIGSNGAGKSTLFNTLSGVYPPYSGKIYLNNKDITKMPEYKRAAFIGRIYQNPLLGTAGNMSIAENMTLCSKKGFKGLKITLNQKSKVKFIKQLATLGMGLENRLEDSVGLLSGGQRQALTLLTTVISKPDLLLLDEHTAALDPGNANDVMKLTQKFIREYQMTAMMVTHNMQQAIEYGNRLILMDKGNIMLDIKEEEKSKLTVTKLIEIFKDIKSSMSDNDEIMLEDY